MVRIGTLYDVCLASGKARDAKACYMAKEDGRWREFSYEHYIDRVEAMSLALHDVGLVKGDRVAILSENRPEWFWTDMGAVAIGIASAPIYSTYPANRVQALLQDSGAKAIVCSNAAQLAKVQEVRAHLPALTHVIVCDAQAARGHTDVHTMEAFLARGRVIRDQQPQLHAELAARVVPSDLATIIYTSGTTGVEKGAMLTHANFTQNCEETAGILEVRPEDSTVLFLPLAHIFARVVQFFSMFSGLGMSYPPYGFTPDVLFQCFEERQPTFVTSVPRIFEKVYSAASAKMAEGSPIKKKIASWAFGVGRAVSKERQAGREGHFQIGRDRQLLP